MSGTRGGVGRIVAMGIALALALLLLAAREATAGKYTVAQCGWYVDADADWADTTGGAKFRPDACCVPPAGADPFDGVHMKSFTRTARDRLRHPLRPLALGGAAGRPGSPRSAAPGGTPCTTGWSSGSAPATGAAASTPSLTAAAHRHDPARLRRRLPLADAGDRGPPALRPRPKSKWCSLEPGSWSAVRALTITVEDDSAAGAADRRRPGRRRLAARQPARRLLGRRRRRRGPLRRNAARRQPGWGSPSTPAPRPRSAANGGRRGCGPARPNARPPTRSRRPASATARTGSSTARPTSPATAPASAASTVLIDNNPPAHPRDARAGRRRRLAPRQRLRPRLGEPRPGAGEPDRRRLLADHRPGRLRHRRPGSPPAATVASLADLSRARAPAPTRCSSGCATRPATKRRPRRSTVPLRFDDVPPGVAFEPAERRRRCREQVSADGQRRALRPGRRADRLPAARRRATGSSCRPSSQPRRAPGRPRLVAPMPRPRSRHLRLPRRRRRRRRQHAPRPRAAPTAPRWRCARSPPHRWRRAERRRAGAGEDAALRPAALAATAAATR